MTPANEARRESKELLCAIGRSAVLLHELEKKLRSARADRARVRRALEEQIAQFQKWQEDAR